MIKLSNLISEKFEIPSALQKQLENTAYSALGYILSPYIEKFKKKLFDNKRFNEESYNTLKNVFDTIRTFTQGSVGNTKLTIKNVMVPEYFSVTAAKKVTKKVNVTIEKTDKDIYVESDEKKDRLFPNMVISKDYAGWDLGKLNKEWNRFESDYEYFQEEFDNQLVTTEQLQNTMERWKTLDKPKKPKIKPDNQKMALVYEKEMPDGTGKYDHYFRVMPSKKVDQYDSPDHFFGAFRPYIVQTVYLDQFNPNTTSIEHYLEDVYKFVATSRHEGRHLIQFYGQKTKGLKGDYYGGPPKSLSHKYDPLVRGVDPSGTAKPKSKYKEPTDRWGRVIHPHRSVEFKTNLYNYKEDIEEFLNKNLPRGKWKEGFQDLIKYIAGVYNYNSFRQKYPRGYSWEYSIAKNHLTELYKHDRPKFNEFIRELYKLIFPN